MRIITLFSINKASTVLCWPFLLVLLILLSGCHLPRALLLSEKNSDSLLEADVVNTATVDIVRDAYGTPHVFADSNVGVYYGYGYAVATDRLFQMEMLKRTVQGRVSEVLGAPFIDLDKMIRTSYDHRAVKRQLAQISKQERQILDAYARGFNHRINEVLDKPKSLLPKEFDHHDFLPKHWTAYDVAMIFVGSIAHRYSDFNSELDNLKLLEKLTQQHDVDTAWAIFNASKWVLDDYSPATVKRTLVPQLQHGPTRPDYLTFLAPLHGTKTPATKRIVLDQHGAFWGTSDQPEAQALLQNQIATEGFNNPEFSPASNVWLVNKKVQGAKGVLVNGPQFGWGVPSYVYGIGLHGGDFNVVGNTLLGLPALLFAHNNKVAWGSTAGMSDQVDVYIEQLHPDDPQRYWHQQTYKTFESWAEIIKVRDQDDIEVTARRSVHGMVVQMQPNQNRAYVRARAWEGAELNTLMAWIHLAKESNLNGVRKRLKNIATNINFYYMDTAGNIGFTHGGRYPLRAKLHDSRLPALGAGDLDWLGYRPYSDNPTTLNPVQGYIANWNNRPAQGWLGSDLWPYTWSRVDRVKRIIDELESTNLLTQEAVWQINENVSFDDVSGSFLLPALLTAWQDHQHDQAHVNQALQHLRNWNQEWRIDANGNYGTAPLILETWLNTLFARVIKDDVGDDNFALYRATQNPNKALGPSMPSSVGVKVIVRNIDFLKAGKVPDYDFFNQQDFNVVLRESFVDSLDMLVKQQGEHMHEWTLKAAPMLLKPYNFRGVPQASESSVITFPSYMNRGSENNMFVANGDGFTAYDVIPAGQSGHISIDGKQSPHYADQVPLFADFKIKLVPFSQQNVRDVSNDVKQILISPISFK